MANPRNSSSFSYLEVDYLAKGISVKLECGATEAREAATTTKIVTTPPRWTHQNYALSQRTLILGFFQRTTLGGLNEPRRRLQRLVRQKR